MPTYKLMYFDAMWLAEPARWMFAQAGQEYEDYRFKREQWPELKPKTPLGQAPVLVVDGIQLAQTKAICRYLAKQFGMIGTTDMDQARGDMLVDYVDDMRAPLSAMHGEQNEDKRKELLKKFLEEKLPECLANFEKNLKENNGGDGFLVGDKVTWSDFYFVHFVSLILHLVKDKEGASNVVIDNYPKVKALISRVQALPAIAAWISKRPKTEH